MLLCRRGKVPKTFSLLRLFLEWGFVVEKCHVENITWGRRKAGCSSFILPPPFCTEKVQRLELNRIAVAYFVINVTPSRRSKVPLLIMGPVCGPWMGTLAEAASWIRCARGGASAGAGGWHLASWQLALSNGTGCTGRGGEARIKTVYLFLRSARVSILKEGK